MSDFLLLVSELLVCRWCRPQQVSLNALRTEKCLVILCSFSISHTWNPVKIYSHISHRLPKSRVTESAGSSPSTQKPVYMCVSMHAFMYWTWCIDFNVILYSTRSFQLFSFKEISQSKFHLCILSQISEVHVQLIISYLIWPSQKYGVCVYVCMYTGVPGGKDLTSGECSLGHTIPI